jgi:DNA polymerase III epsilon subunit-like protein
MPFAVLDTETTGFVPRVHHVVELACERYEGGAAVGTFEALTKAPDELPPHVQVLTRIYPDMLEGKPRIAEVAEEFTRTLGADTLLVGQNLQFDLGMLKGEGIDLTARPWVDTSLLAALVFPELKSYSLQYLSKALGLPHEPQHRALGDVRATAALLGAIWDRLCELPAANLAEAKDVMARSSDGYRLFFAALPTDGGKGEWLSNARARTPSKGSAPVPPPPSAPGSVTILEERIDPAFLPSLIAGAAADGVPTWIAVKNLDSALKRHEMPSGVSVVYPPSLLLDPDAAERLRDQGSFTPEEATLALKLSWFKPAVRADLALHAGERDTWNGKLAATADHPAYVGQHAGKGTVHVLDHRQLLEFLAEPTREEDVMPRGCRVIVDDASMLEDTATKAFGSWVALDDLRAAAQGNDALTKIADNAALWAEMTKGGMDQRVLAPMDFDRPETKGLAALADGALEDAALPPRVRYLLSQLKAFLRPAAGVPMLSWIETRAQSGSVNLTSAPERVDLLLKKLLFDPFATVLLAPPGLKGALPAAVPEGYPRTLVAADPDALKTYPVAFPDDTLERLLENPPAGKTIALAGSKRTIENAFIKHTVRLEGKDVTLICQGMSGGQGRMESDFLAAEGTTVWMLTPWMYEGIDLPEGSADHLVIESVPFDHPGQPVFARRKDMFQNGFEQYALTRLYHRLFRLLRAFGRHARPGADVAVLDQRMKEKSYGEKVRSYLSTFATSPAPAFASKPVGPAAAKKPRAPKNDGPQQALPL